MGSFDLMCLRNVVATYHAAQVQREIVARIAHRIRAGAVLVLGIHEALPVSIGGFAPRPNVPAASRKVTQSRGETPAFRRRANRPLTSPRPKAGDVSAHETTDASTASQFCRRREAPY